jgi:putative transposase
VQRCFSADRPSKLWFTDITQHRTAEGWVYCAAVLDVYSWGIVGWSIADHLRTELVVDALQMARWRRDSTGTAEAGQNSVAGGFSPVIARSALHR